MRSPFRTTLLVGVALAALGAPASASANAFVIQTCGVGSRDDGWSTTNTNPGELASGAQCAPQAGNMPGYPSSKLQSGLWVGDRLSNAGGSVTEVTRGAEVRQTFTAAAGTTITRLRYWRLLLKADDHAWRPYIALGDGTIIDTCDFALGATSCQVAASDWSPPGVFPVQTERGSYRDLTGLSTTGLRVGLRCDAVAPFKCMNGYSLHQVEVDLYARRLWRR